MEVLLYQKKDLETCIAFNSEDFSNIKSSDLYDTLSLDMSDKEYERIKKVERKKLKWELFLKFEVLKQLGC